jgi:hypothetical protein
MTETPERDLERALPADHFDILVPSMVPSELPLHASISTETPYAYFEVDRTRFGWFRDPSGMIGAINDVYALGRWMTGEVYWAVRIGRYHGDWRVEKASTWDSLSAARLAAGLELAERAGYQVDFQAGRWVLGPAAADFANPGRYLELAFAARKRRKRTR